MMFKAGDLVSIIDDNIQGWVVKVKPNDVVVVADDCSNEPVSAHIDHEPHLAPSRLPRGVPHEAEGLVCNRPNKGPNSPREDDCHLPKPFAHKYIAGGYQLSRTESESRVVDCSGSYFLPNSLFFKTRTNRIHKLPFSLQAVQYPIQNPSQLLLILCTTNACSTC